MSNITATRRTSAVFKSFRKLFSHRESNKKRETGEILTRNGVIDKLRTTELNDDFHQTGKLDGASATNGVSIRTAPTNKIVSNTHLKQNEVDSRNEKVSPRLSNVTSFEVEVSSIKLAINQTMDVSEDSDIETDSPIDNKIASNTPDLYTAPTNKAYLECSKHPGHNDFIPIQDLRIQHLSPSYQSQDWVKFIQLKGADTVFLEVSYTSTERPDSLGSVPLKGTTEKRTGCGTAFIKNMNEVEDCYCSEIPGFHKISGRFTVMTVAHVVFDDQEAQDTVVKFFFDDESDMSKVVTARGERVCHVDVQKNRSVIECRTHDLSLYQRLSNLEQERLRLVHHSLTTQVNNEPMVVLISHPHGLSKRVSIGRLLDKKEDGEIKKTNDGTQLIGCILKYNTPTCPGSGGGSINVIGNGEVCSAFAPHAASLNNVISVSGLGWAKYVTTT